MSGVDVDEVLRLGRLTGARVGHDGSPFVAVAWPAEASSLIVWRAGLVEGDEPDGRQARDRHVSGIRLLGATPPHGPRRRGRVLLGASGW